MRLDEVMSFDRVVCVHADDSVSDAPAGVYAPALEMGCLDNEEGSILAGHEEAYSAEAARQGWEVMTAGYSSQYRYRGLVMHACESIGNCLERDILAVPGYYAALAIQMADGRDDHDAGWTVVRRTVPGALAAARARVMATTWREANEALSGLRRAVALARACGVPRADVAAMVRDEGSALLILACDHPVAGVVPAIYAEEPPALRRHAIEPSLCSSTCPARCLQPAT